VTDDRSTQCPTVTVGGVPLRAGVLLRIGAEASVQFRGTRGFVLRLVRVPNWPTYHGWIWLEGYQLDERGEAVDRRTIFVQIAGLRVLRSPTDHRPLATQGRHTARPRRAASAGHAVRRGHAIPVGSRR